MKIVKFTAENIKGIKAIEIIPETDNVAISGRNGQGKSSILDGIHATLVGGALQKSAGSERGEVAIDLGDYTIQRIITEKTDRLIVKTKDGAAYSNGRTVLSQLVGPLSIDPLAFVRLKDKDQAKVIFDMNPSLEKNLADADAKIAAIREERSLIGREGEREKIKADEMPIFDGVGESVDVAELLKEITATNERNNLIEQQVRHIAEKRLEEKKLTVRAISIHAEIAALEKSLVNLTGEHKKISMESKKLCEECDALDKKLEPKIDISELNKRVSESQKINQKVQANQDKAKALQAVEKLRAQYSEKLQELKQAEHDKVLILSNAKLPLSGLSVLDGRVIFNGIPIDELSTAEKVRVGASLAVAQNPKAKIILADDASLLDKENLKTLQEICAGFQLWTVFNDESGDVGFYIEAGEAYVHGQKIEPQKPEKPTTEKVKKPTFGAAIGENVEKADFLG